MPLKGATPAIPGAPGFKQTDDHPWSASPGTTPRPLAQRLSQREGVRYRLPTEAEWGIRLPGPDANPLPHGDDLPHLTQYANSSTNPQRRCGPKEATRLPGSKRRLSVHRARGQLPPNSWGLHDTGNVWNGSDLARRGLLRPIPTTDPQGSETGSVRIAPWRLVAPGPLLHAAIPTEQPPNPLHAGWVRCACCASGAQRQPSRTEPWIAPGWIHASPSQPPASKHQKRQLDLPTGSARAQTGHPSGIMVRTKP